MKLRLQSESYAELEWADSPLVFDLWQQNVIMRGTKNSVLTLKSLFEIKIEKLIHCFLTKQSV